MIVVLVVLMIVFGVAGWWLSGQRLMAKPWLEQGSVAAFPGTESGTMPTAKVGMGMLLAVIGCLFALFTSAYAMRMEYADWTSLPVPTLLWLNTGILVLSSVALQCTLIAARNGQTGMVRLGLVTGGMTAIAFLIGQIAVWRELEGGGHFLTANPANSFFYLITGMHGLHIAGGLAGLARTAGRAWSRETRRERLILSVELSAMYWHFLLVVWLALFVVLAGWAERFIDVCRQLLT